MQTYFAQKASSYLSKELNTTINLSKISIHPFDRIILEDLLVLDLQNDTLVNTKSLDVQLKDISLTFNSLHFKKIALQEANIKLIKPKGQSGFSFQFIIDYFSSEKKDTTPSAIFPITVTKLEIKNSNIYFIDKRATDTYHGMDFGDLAFKNINLTMSSIKNEGAKTTAFIEHLSTTEKSNFELKNLSGKLEIDEYYARLDSLKIETNKSYLSSKYLEFSFANFSDFEDDFINKVTLKADFNPTNLYLGDLNYFTSFFEGLDRSILFSGKFNGTISDFNTQNFNIKFDNNSYIAGDFNFKGLPDTDSLYFDAHVTELQTTKGELSNIDIPPFTENQKLSLPDELNGMGLIIARGTLKGTLNNVEGDLFAQTKMGIIKTKSHYWINPKTKASMLNGTIQTSNLLLGKFLKNQDIGSLTTKAQVNLIWQNKKQYNASVKGIVNELTYKNYTYKNIRLNGVFSDFFFNGKASIKDKNIDLTFDGLINYKDSVPKFNFTSSIATLNLNSLNLTRDSINRIFCGNIDINGTGSNPDNADGHIHITNFNYYQNGKEYEIEEIEIISETKNQEKKITLNSSLVDASIKGNFLISQLPTSVDYIGSKVIPALYEGKDSIVLSNQNFAFNTTVKNYDPIKNLFTPTLSFSENTTVTGKFSAANTSFYVDFYADTIFLLDKICLNTTAILDKPDEQVNAQIQIEKFHLNNQTVFDNVLFETKLKNNLLEPSLKWQSQNGLGNGFIQGNGYWYSLNYFDFLILPSYINFNNTTWNTTEYASLIIDGKKLIFSEFGIENQVGEGIVLSGTVSENPEDTLVALINHFKLENINGIMGLENVQYYGDVNGKVQVKEIYKNPIFTSTLNVDSLKANKEYIGDLALNAYWNDKIKEIEAKGTLMRNNKKAFDVIGSYYPLKKKNSLNLVCVMDETPIGFIGPYLQGQGISELYGDISGDIKILGEPNHPLLDGKTKFENIGFKVDYLNTHYKFTGEVILKNDNIYTNNNIVIRDINNNYANFNAFIYHNNYRDFSYNFVIDIPDKLETNKKNKSDGTTKPDNLFFCLNTTPQLNSDFYGKVYATGKIEVEGARGEMGVTVKAKTKKGTVFTLPLYGSSEVVLEDYIIFVDSTKKIREEKLANLEGLNLDLDIELTPDAEIELIFDEVYGDAMKGSGNGNLAISVDKNNELSMSGQYVIDKGQYLFTLGVLNFENVVNKKFQIASGSTINWYGDPYNAEIDIDAIYKLKASLYDLMTTYPPEVREKYKNRTDVECYMNLSQNLMNPAINFSVALPRADENAKSALAGAIQTEEELNKQVFSLLILNRFIPPANSVSNDSKSGGAVGSTASELLSNQLSNWLSKLSDDVNIGLNYRPGDNVSDDEIAVALSTELINDRLVFSSNLGVSTSNRNSQSPLVGDVSLEYKLNKDGTFRVRAFTRSNEYDITSTNQSSTTQGVGLYYKREFNNLKEFFPFKKNKNGK